MTVKGIVVARSRKRGGFCLVVYDLNDKRFYRIVSSEQRNDRELTKDECTYINGDLIENLDLVEVEVESKIPLRDDFQHENVVMKSPKFTFIRKSNKNELLQNFGLDLNFYDDVFINSRGSMTIDEAKQMKNSFILARVFNLEFNSGTNVNGEIRCKCSFKYNRKEYTNFSVTISETPEEDIRKYCNKKRYPVALVCFSYGHPYEGKCYKYLCSFLGLLERY